MSKQGELNRDALTSALDCLVPREGAWPGAGSLGLADAVLKDADVDGHRSLIQRVLAALPERFVSLDARDKVSAMQAVEASTPAAFSTLVRHTYNVYYSHPAVLKVLEAETGYPARPPLYVGYEMEPFDPAVIATQKKRQPFWRKV